MFKSMSEMFNFSCLLLVTTHFTDMCIPHFFFRFRTAFDGRRSTQAWLHNLAPFQVFVDTSVIQDKTLTIYINFRKFKLEKAPNFVTRPASNVDRRTPFGSEKKYGMHISVKCVVNNISPIYSPFYP